MDSLVRQWLERAEYDLETAKSLFESKRYLYVAFLCQQCVEKLIKGYMTAKGTDPPFIHNLVRLAEDAGIMDLLAEERGILLADLNPFYIKARYGAYKDGLAKVCSAGDAKRFLNGAEDFLLWLKPKLK